MRLIDADALKDEVLSWAVLIDKPHLLGKEDTIFVIDNAPTIEAVQVVRCKDCKREWICGKKQWFGENGYCSNGERKEWRCLNT